jgi:hypothetical protein
MTEIWRDANMARPAMSSITCSACNASYGSQRELRDHMLMAHPRISLMPSVSPSSVQANGERKGCTPSFLMERRGEMDKSCGRNSAERQEEYTQPDEEKESGGEA